MAELETGASGSGEPVDDFDSIVADAAAALHGAVVGEDTNDVTDEGVKVEDPAPAKKKSKILEEIIPEDEEGVGGFFKGKPVLELVKSQKYAEAKIEEQGRELNRLRAEMAAKEAAGSVLEKLLAAKEKPEEPKRPAPLPDVISEPTAYAEELERRNAARLNELLDERQREADQRAAAEAIVIRNVTTANESILRFRNSLPQMDDKKFDRLAVALINEVKDHPDEYPEGLLGEGSYFSAYKSIVGEIPQREQEEEPERVVTDRANPPSFGRSAPRPTRAALAVPSLRREQEEIVDRITSTMLAAAGLSGDDFEAAKLEVMGEAAKRIASPRRTA